ncbi:MAG: FAD-dependent oxidoreductase [Rhodospirillales bacterium]|nr:FAD-dependent oxidoreductase [Rhodospirillales bacterium]
MSENSKHRVVIVGGGFGGVFTAKHLRRLAGSGVHIELISRNNFFVFQPLLPEVAGGNIHPADAVSPLRLFLPGVCVRVADARKIDLLTKTVHVTVGRDREITAIPYDHLVIALGQVVDLSRTPGLADRALVMKDVVDAFQIRNQLLGCLEDADSTPDPRRRRRLLTFVVIGGGFTGVETLGEMQELLRKSLRYYPSVRPDEVRIVLIQHGSRILPELPEHLAAYASAALRRRGVEIMLSTGVKAVTNNGIETDGGLILDAETIVAAIGNAPSPLMRTVALPLDHGRIVVDRCLRVRGMDDVWALGDNAHIPLGDPNDTNTAYAPPLAQFAVREAKVLAGNIVASFDGRALATFEYRAVGAIASLGGRSGVADIRGVRVSGFFAWVAWRLLYLGFLPGLSTRIRVAVDWALDLFISRSIVEIRPARSTSRSLRLLRGDLVIEPGIEPAGVYVVISGSFERTTSAPGEQGASVHTCRLAPGECFGLSLDGTPPPVPEWVRACEDSMAYVIDKSDLKHLAMVSALVEKRGQAIVNKQPERA